MLLSEAGWSILQNSQVTYRDASHPRVCFPLEAAVSKDELTGVDINRAHGGLWHVTSQGAARDPGGAQPEPAAEDRESPPHCSHYQTIKPPTFDFFILSWLLNCLQTGTFSLLSAQFILLVSFHNAAIAFFTSQVTEAAITSQTLDCHCWQNEAGDGGERKFYSVITKANE